MFTEPDYMSEGSFSSLSVAFYTHVSSNQTCLPGRLRINLKTFCVIGKWSAVLSSTQVCELFNGAKTCQTISMLKLLIVIGLTWFQVLAKGPQKFFEFTKKLVQRNKVYTFHRLIIQNNGNIVLIG